MIANHIAYYRASLHHGKGVSQAHLARQVGVSRSFMTKLEKGVAQPGAELMLRLARYLGEPVERLFVLNDGGGGKPALLCQSTIPFRQVIQTEPQNNLPGTSPSVPGEPTIIDGINER